MKILQVTIALLLVCLMQPALAQIDHCRVTYEVEFEEDEMEEADPMTMAMLKDMSMVMAFQGQKARVEMDMGMIRMRSITDQVSGKTLILTDAMGNKSAQITNLEEDERMQAAKDQEVEVRETGKRKKIAGYECFQIFVSPKGQSEEIEMWYTPEIKVANTANQYIYKGVNGFPLEMLVDQQGIKMRMVASAVETDKMDPALFSTEVPKGYVLQDGN